MYFIIQRFIFRKHLEDGEEIFFVAHKHFVAIILPIIKVIIFGFLAPWLFYILLGSTLMFYIAVIWTISAFVKLLYELTDWYCDAWLITSLGVVDLEWKGLFEHSSSRIEYPSVEGVSYQFKGFWETVLKYGRTQIDRISSNNPVVLECANNPKQIELKVLHYKSEFEEERGRMESNNLKQMISNLVLKHMKNGDEEGTEDGERQRFSSREPEKVAITIENLDED